MPAPTISEFQIIVNVTSNDSTKGTITSGGGTHSSSVYVCSNTERNVPRFTAVATAKSGYAFSSWQVISTTGPSGYSARVVFGSQYSSSTTILGCGTLPEPSSAYTELKYITINIQAIFVGQYTLTTGVNNSSMGTVSPSGSNTYVYGTTVSVTATPKTGYKFNNWSTGSTANPLSVTMTSSLSLTANFAGNIYTVTLNKNGGSGGSASVTATYGLSMPTATMPTRTGYDFTGYYDAVDGGNQYYKSDGTSFKAWDKASNTTLYAQWKKKKYTLTLQVNYVARGKVVPDPEGTSAGTGKYTYDYGTQVTLTATPFTAWKFNQWTVGSTSTLPQIVVTVTANATYKAEFVKDTSYVFGQYRSQVKVAKASSQSSWGTVSTEVKQGTTWMATDIISGYKDITWSGVYCPVSGRIKAVPNRGYRFVNWQISKSYAPSAPDDSAVITYGTPTFDDEEALTEISVNPRMKGTTDLLGEYGNETQNLVTYTATASFAQLPQYTVTLSANPTSGGTVTGGGTYYGSESVTITATPSEGMRFVSWMDSNDTVSTNPTYTFTISSNRTFTASFRRDPDYVYKTANGQPATFRVKVQPFVKSGQEDYGTVSGTDLTSSYANITGAGLIKSVTATIVATPNIGYKFSKWTWTETTHSDWYEPDSNVDLSFDSSSSRETTAIASAKFAGSLDENYSYFDKQDVVFKVQATFTEDSYTVGTATNDASMGTVTGGGNAKYLSQKTVTAVPKSGYQVYQWELLGPSQAYLIERVTTHSNTYTFTMPSNAVVAKAYFQPIALSDYKVGIHITSSEGGSASKEDTYYSDYSDITVAGVRKYFSVENVTVTALPGYSFSEWEVTLEREPAQWVSPTSTSSPKSSWYGWATDNPYSTGNTYDLNTDVFYVGTVNGDYTKDRNVLIKFNAKFVKLTDAPYHVSFHAIAGTGGTITQGGAIQNSAIKELGTAVGIYNSPINCQPNTGYHFTGWTWLEPVWTNEYASSSYLNKSLSSASTTASNLVTIEARWDKKSGVVYDMDGESISVKIQANFSNQYTATFNKTGGTGGTNTVTATYGSAMPTITIPHKSGYKFVGYFDSRNGNIKYYNEDGTSARTWDMAQNATLYAHWELAGAKVMVYTSTGWKECGGIKKCTSISGGTPTWVKAPVMKAKNTSTSIIWT